MRKLLDALYNGAAWLAALCLVGLLVMVLLSIVSRQIGFHVPGTDAYAGYLMAGCGFLALDQRRVDHYRQMRCATRQGRQNVAQRGCLRPVELEVIGGHRHALRAQVFSQDAADFAVADEPDLPALRIGVHAQSM